MNQKPTSSRPMSDGLLVVALLCLGGFWFSCSESPPPAEEPDPNQLEYVTPESVGYSSAELAQARQLAVHSGYAAVMAAVDGKVFFSHGEVSRNFYVHSIRKSFLSALYGIHRARGAIDLDATLEELNIDDIPPSLTAEEKQATVRDLLTSRSGVYHEAAAEAQEMIDTRPLRGAHAPGTFYYYNNWDFNALGTIFEQQTGTKIFEEFKSQIADGVGMEDFSVANCFYQFEPQKSEHPAYHFRMSARDMLRFGILYLNNGNWRGRQIIPSAWITESTTVYAIMDSTFGVGYGYLWMIAPEGSPAAQLFVHPSYFHTGAGVHLVGVMPAADLVIVLRINTDGNFIDPGDDAQMQLVSMIVNARN